MPTSRPCAVAAWRIAATAPQDGSHILVTRLGEQGFGICAGDWQDWNAVVHYWPVVDEEGFYLSSGGSSEIDDRPVLFTHWMPLPTIARCSCDYALQDLPGVTHQPDCPLAVESRLRAVEAENERLNGVIAQSLSMIRDLHDSRLADAREQSTLRVAYREIERLAAVVPSEERPNDK